MLPRAVLFGVVIVACGVCRADGRPTAFDADGGAAVFAADLGRREPAIGPAMDATGDELRTSCCDVASGCPADADDDCRVYVSKVLGVTFLNLKTSAVQPAGAAAGVSPVWSSPTSTNGSLFTAALVGGVRVPRPGGALRLECEGALRDDFNQSRNPANETAITIQANDDWTALANLWRDVAITRRLGVYAGGGVGGGGYWLTASGPDGSALSHQQAAFAWQAGGGLIWRYNSLVALDASYRFLSFADNTATLTQPGLGAVGTVTASMTAGELFLMLRVYEPFQWRRHLVNRAFYLPE